MAVESEKTNVTLKTVAAPAGVSPTTVSFVLSGDTSVCTPDMSRDILRIAEEMNYRTPRSRRSVRAGKAPSTELLAAIEDLTEQQQRIIWGIIEVLRRESLMDQKD